MPLASLLAVSITVSHCDNQDVDVEPLLLLRKFAFLLGIDICVDICVAVEDKSSGKQCSIDVKISNRGVGGLIELRIQGN